MLDGQNERLSQRLRWRRSSRGSNTRFRYESAHGVDFHIEVPDEASGQAVAAKASRAGFDTAHRGFKLGLGAALAWSMGTSRSAQEEMAAFFVQTGVKRLMSLCAVVLFFGCSSDPEEIPPGTCLPTTCNAAGANCGTVVDGCGGDLDCGACDVGQTCGAGGPNLCAVGECVPATCGQDMCGRISDGCGSVVDCGGCSGALTCGGGGVANQCGEGCVARTCNDVGAQCGALDNQCGQTLNCGMCSAPDVCGGDGVANQCGQSCTPRTCADVGAVCGQLDDGCGNTLECGVCDAALMCGGGGTDNQCGAQCSLSCPSGFTCDVTRGVCAGGSPQGLAINVVTHTVSGVVTMNGLQPDATCNSADRGVVRFTEANLGYNIQLPIPCNGTTTPFNYGGEIFPGTYRVSVSGTQYSSLPGEWYVVQENLQISGDMSLNPNVVTHTVSGVVTMNGLQPDATCNSADRATVRFTEQNLGYNIQLAVPCNGTTTPFNYSGAIFPGTYRVSVSGTQYSSLPGEWYVVQENLQISADTQLNPNVVTHTVSGVVTMNGAQPDATCNSADRATVRFTEANLGYNIQLPVPCNGTTTPFNYSGQIFPGTYRVSVSGTQYSSLPGEWYVVQENLQVTGDLSLNPNVLTYTVNGVVTMNGLQPDATCNSADRGTMRFTETNLGYNIQLPIPCNGTTTPFTYSGQIFPGTYRVSVSGTEYSSLPGEWYIVQPSLQVTGNLAVNADVVTHTVSGVVTMNGLQPMATCNSADRASVRFTEMALGYNITVPVPCNGTTTPFSFGAEIFPGTYRVSVSGTQYSELPSESYVVQTSLQVSADTQLNLDVATRSVSGVITMNGVQPDATCNSADRAVVRFVETTLGYNLQLPVPCNGTTTPFTFEGEIYPGVYRLSVSGTQYSSLPGEWYVVTEALEVL